MAIEVKNVAIAVVAACGGLCGAGVGPASAAFVLDLKLVGRATTPVCVLSGDDLAGATVDCVSVHVDGVATASVVAGSGVIGGDDGFITVEVNVTAPVTVSNMIVRTQIVLDITIPPMVVYI